MLSEEKLFRALQTKKLSSHLSELEGQDPIKILQIL